MSRFYGAFYAEASRNGCGVDEPQVPRSLVFHGELSASVAKKSQVET